MTQETQDKQEYYELMLGNVAVTHVKGCQFVLCPMCYYEENVGIQAYIDTFNEKVQ